MVGNTIDDDPASEVIWRRTAPGISYLLTSEHVQKLAPHIDKLTAFDWEIPAILGGRFAVCRTSLLDHLGVGGLHHPEGVGYDGGDIARNPHPSLITKRAEIIARLKAKDAR